MNNLMIDIETMGTKPGCVILSIGAVLFGGGQLGREFYIEIDPTNCQAHGMTINADTLRWWMRQEIKPPVNGAATLEHALRRLSGEFNNWREMCVWANSPTFDLAILRDAYARVSMKAPWPFWQERDFRSARDILAPDFSITTVRPFGDTHHALADAKRQAKALMMMGLQA